MTVRVNKGSFNIREKLTELGRRFGLKGSEIMAAETVQEARDLVSAGRKNLLINGSFQIWQRSTDYENTTDSWNYYSVDRFRHNKGRYRQVTATVDGREVKALEVSPSSGVYNGGRAFYHLLEDYKAYNKTTTISAYVKSDVPSSVEFGRIWNYDTSANVPGSGKTIQTTTTFQKFEVTNPSFDPNQPPGQYVINELQDGVTYTIANVQLEIGKNATDFEYRSYGEELALCQRYYIQYATSSDFRFAVLRSNGSSTQSQLVAFPTTMRSVPDTKTVITQPTTAKLVRALDDTTGASYTTLSVNANTAHAYYVVANVALSNAAQILVFNAVYAFSAEL